MRFQALVVHEAVGQRGEKKVKEDAAERDDEPQAEELTGPVVGGGCWDACESKHALV